MIIPIKCVTCGTVLADKYQYYLEQCRRKKMEKNGGKGVEGVIYYTREMVDKKINKTPEGEVLDELGLTNVCCRRVMLTHVDIE